MRLEIAIARADWRCVLRWVRWWRHQLATPDYRSWEVRGSLQVWVSEDLALQRSVAPTKHSLGSTDPQNTDRVERCITTYCAEM